MRKTIATILVVLGVAVIVAGFSLQAFPEWLSLPGGVLLLVAGAFLGVAELGGKLKDWRDFLFGEESNVKKTAETENSPSKRSISPPARQRSQEMVRSEDGEQGMHGQVGIQKQEMYDSPRGKQNMD